MPMVQILLELLLLIYFQENFYPFLFECLRENVKHFDDRRWKIMNQYKKVDEAVTAPPLLQKAEGNNKIHLKFFSFLSCFFNYKSGKENAT